MHITDGEINFILAITGTPAYLLILILISLYLYLYKKQHLASVLFIVFFVINYMSVVILKNIFKIPRPDSIHIEASTYAFPSGHTAAITFIVFAVLLCINIFTKNKKYHPLIYIIGLSAISFIGWSRVYLSAHTIYQIFGGLIVGLFWAYMYKNVIKYKLKQR